MSSPSVDHAALTSYPDAERATIALLHDLVAIPLALEELELAAHASLDERARQVLDPPRAELPLPSVHVVPEGDGHAPALGLGAEELVEGLEALAFSAHRCWRVVRLSWVSIVG